MFTRLLNALQTRRTAAPGAPRRARRLAPECSALESRALLANTGPFGGVAAARYVQELYVDVLQRIPSQPEVNYWVNAMSNGRSISQIAHAFVTSNEYHTLLVQQDYQNYLGHAADPAGLALLVNQLNQGASPVTVQRELIASPEFQAAHVSNLSYINALYADILGRGAEPAGAAYWVSQLQSGASRDQVAAGFFNSLEYRNRVVNSDFNLVLGRSAEPGGLQYWSSNLSQDGLDDDHLLVALFVSNENLHNIVKTIV